MFMFAQMGRGGATSACASTKKLLTLSDGPAYLFCANVWCYKVWTIAYAKGALQTGATKRQKLLVS